MRLFAEAGYHAATNAMIADAAHLTRGAMLYHFPTRDDLVAAGIEHIQVERLALFDAAAASLRRPAATPPPMRSSPTGRCSASCRSWLSANWKALPAPT